MGQQQHARRDVQAPEERSNAPSGVPDERAAAVLRIVQETLVDCVASHRAACR